MQILFRASIALLLLAGITAVHAANGLEAVLNDRHTVFFLILNLALTIYFAGIRFDRFAVVHGPEILTTVGIFGCFFGIALALLNFDATNVTSSVPALLEGVKTAFWASVSGVFGALVIRFRHRVQKEPIPQSAGAPKAASMDDVVASLQALQRSLSGNEEGSLLTQLKLMRQEQSDQLSGLRSSFDTFAKRMAEDGSKALISALREVIADFNAKINEQFGENFKLLNAAVEKLVIWQQQYKEELDRLQAVQKSSADDLRVAAAGFASVVERSAAFADSARQLGEMLHALDQQYTLMKENQESMSKALLQLKEVTPEFSRKLSELTEGMRIGVTKVQSDVAEVVRNLGVQVQSSQAEMKSLLVDTLKKSQTETNAELTRSLEAVRQGVVTLDKGLQEGLTKSLETLGRQLASLSEKFVADYTPLTQRLRELIEVAKVR